MGQLTPPSAAIRPIALGCDDLDLALRLQLLEQGYEATPMDTWGRLCGPGTAFIEVYDGNTLAWVYMVDADAFLGDRLDISGPPAAAVPEAIRQLNLVLAAHEVSAALPLHSDSSWEALTA